MQHLPRSKPIFTHAFHMQRKRSSHTTRPFLALAILAISTWAHATIQMSSGPNWVLITFQDQTFAPEEFVKLDGLFQGALTSVDLNVTIADPTENGTWAEDLTLRVNEDPSDFLGNALLQIGGVNSFPVSDADKYFWPNGGPEGSASGSVGTAPNEEFAPIAFNGLPTDPVLWIGNGFDNLSFATTETWTGTLQLNGLTLIPEPSSLVLLGLSFLTLLGWKVRRT